MNDPVDRVIQERRRLDGGFSGGLLVSLVAHFVLVGVAVAAPLLFPAKAVIPVAEGFAVPLPRGGGGRPAPPPATAAPPRAEAPAPAAPEPPKVVQPPKEEPKASTKAVPELDPRKSRKRKEQPATAPPGESKTASPAAGPATPGLALMGPPGPGSPGGTDSGGDWYLAGVQQKIWLIWNQQVRSGFRQAVAVTFTILEDGSLADVEITQSSGATLLDLAARRAVYSAAPFSPLPKIYGTKRKTIQAVFTPVP